MKQNEMKRNKTKTETSEREQTSGLCITIAPRAGRRGERMSDAIIVDRAPHPSSSPHPSPPVQYYC
jgi:hypothetical protein